MSNRFRTASGRSFRRDPLVDLQTWPIPYEADAFPGAAVLLDGEVYLSVRTSELDKYRWSKVFVIDSVLRLVLGEEDDDAATPFMVGRAKNDSVAPELYEIGTPGIAGFGMGALAPSDVPPDYVPVSGSTYVRDGRDFANYSYRPSDGVPNGASGLGAAFATAPIEPGEVTNFRPASLLLDVSRGEINQVALDGRVRPLGVPAVPSPIPYDAALMPGYVVTTPDGRAWQSQQWNGTGSWRWGVMVGHDPATGTTQLDGNLATSQTGYARCGEAFRFAAVDVPESAKEIGTPGQLGFGVGCCAVDLHPDGIVPLNGGWMIPGNASYGNYVMPGADGDIGLVTTDTAILNQPVADGQIARYRLGSTSIHPHTGVHWTVATSGTWAKQSTFT